MRKYRHIVIILLLALTLSSCSLKNDEQPYDKSRNEHWIEDIDYLKTNLSKKHKKIDHSISKEEYEKKFTSLKKDVPKLNDYEIKLRLSQIVASVGDAHTSLSIRKNENDKLYPFGVRWYGNDLKVYAVDKDYKDIIGNNLTAINNIPIEKVMTSINTLISHENEQWLKYINASYVYNPKILKFFNIIKKDEAEFTFSDDSGKTTKITFTPTEDKIINVNSMMKSKPVAMQHEYSNTYDNLYWYKYIPEDKIMYFQYNQCFDRATAQMAGYKDAEKYPIFSEFSDKLVNELNEKEVNKFIIDLRNNTGGNSMLMDDFANKLRSIEKLNEKGKIYVLIDKKTFSSGVMACITLKKLTKAIFIGEPTGGNVNGYGEVSTITLPNSKIQVSCSVNYFDMLPGYKEGFTPDIRVEQSFDNYVNGIDDAYEAAKNYKVN